MYFKKGKFFLFIDDDAFFNPKMLVSILKNNITKQMKDDVLYAGRVINGRPTRVRFSKWYLSLETYPYNRYPQHIMGYFYVLNFKSVNRMLNAARYMPSFYIDDVYLGLLAYILDMKIVNLDKIFSYGPIFLPKNMFPQELLAYCGYWGLSSDEILSTWNLLSESIDLTTTIFE